MDYSNNVKIFYFSSYTLFYIFIRLLFNNIEFIIEYMNYFIYSTYKIVTEKYTI